MPFSLLLLVFFIRQHLQGFFVMIWIAAVMFKSNDILRKQTALTGYHTTMPCAANGPGPRQFGPRRLLASPWSISLARVLGVRGDVVAGVLRWLPPAIPDVLVVLLFTDSLLAVVASAGRCAGATSAPV